MSLVTPVCVYLATHPGSELTAQEIALRWSVDPNNVNKTLKYAEVKGWVTCTKRPNPTRATKQILFYSAGPRLLKEIGR